MPVLDECDVIYMHAPTATFRRLIPSPSQVYILAQTELIVHYRLLTHHRVLHQNLPWSSLATRGQINWYIFIYKSIIGKLPGIRSVSDKKGI